MSAGRTSFCACACLAALILVVSVSCVSSYEISYTDSDGVYYYQPSENVRDKRTLGLLLRSFADAIGYDIQKRPSVLPLGAAPAIAKPAAVPVPMAPAPAPMAPAAPAPKAPALPAPAAPAPAVPAAAAPAPVPKVPTAPAPAPMAPPAPAPKVPASPAPMAPAAAPMAPAPAPMAPAAAPMAPAPAPMAPAPAPMAPAPAPMVPAAPAAPVPRPAQAKPPTAPPLLTETIQKMFNINFNWNRNLQPSAAAPAAPVGPRAMPPVAATPAPAPGPVPKSPASIPAAPPLPPAASPNIPAPAPAPVPAPVPVPAAAPAPAPAAAPVPAPAPAPGPAPKTPIMPATKATPTRQQLDYQENEDYADPQQIIYYPDYQESVNQHQINQVQDYEFPRAVNTFWQNSPWNRNNIQYKIQNGPAPNYQEYVTPDGQRGYHVQQYQQNAHLQHQNIPQENNNADSSAEISQDEQIQQAPESAEQQQSQEQIQEQPQYQQEPQHLQQQSPEDVNVDSSKEYYQYNQPRGFQPGYHGSESRLQNGYYRPGLPLSVHGIHEDKVLVAWPSPFEAAETEIKKKITMRDRIQAAGSENQEYNYEPESYGGYSFYEVPEPSKEHNNYKEIADPNIEDELSPNAKISETNYGKKYTNVRVDRNTYKQ